MPYYPTAGSDEPGADLQVILQRLIEQRLKAYEVNPRDIREHWGIEESVLAGGYGYRQVLELVQNGADAVLEGQQESGTCGVDGRIHVQLHGQRLYVANTGAPLSEEGVDALLRSHTSPKRANQIGRFGLGFKSLLKFNGRIDIFTRRSGGIRFDPERCRAELRERFNVEQAPGLRLAWRLAPEERLADPVCLQLGWAETIVRVDVGSTDLLAQLRQEIRSFPAEFLLFFPVSTTLTLDNGEQKERKVSCVVEGNAYLLHDGHAVSRWRLAQREVRITDPRAKADATHIHARESVPLAWAIPLEGRREEAGRFWAFFPTQTQTYLPGILNAPWKLNSDRNAIIGGEWNGFLMTEAAALIADSLPGLATRDDPARPLDAFPRQMNRKDEDAATLVNALWTRLSTAAVVPDANGTLRAAQELWRHPKDAPQLAHAWCALAEDDARRQLVHPSCLEGHDRPSRLDRLAERLGTPAVADGSPALLRCGAQSWFAQIASTDIVTARAVLNLAKLFFGQMKPHEWSAVRPSLEIIPTQSGKLTTASSAVLAPEGASFPGRESVAIELQADDEIRSILIDVLSVREPDDQLWRQILEDALRSVPRTSPAHAESQWREFWFRLRGAPSAAGKYFLEVHGNQIRVRRRDGRWAKADGVLLPGALVAEDGPPRNSNTLVDLATHHNDRALLHTLQVEEIPAGAIGPSDFYEVAGDGGTLITWRNTCRDHYKRTFDNSASWHYLQPGRLAMPRGYQLLEELVGVPNARFTNQLIRRLKKPVFCKPVSFGHVTTKAYPRMEVPHPLPWFLLRHGEVLIDYETTAPLRALVARRDQKVLHGLPDWEQLAPELERLESSFPPVLANSADLSALWNAVFNVLVTTDALQGNSLSDLWFCAAKDKVAPSELPTITGRASLADVFVTTSADLARRARTPDRIVVALDAPTMELWKSQGAKDLSTLIQAEWGHLAGPPERLTDVVPELSQVLREEVSPSARCQRVTGLRFRIENSSLATPCLMCDGTVYIDTEQLSSLSRSERLRCLLAEVAPSGWLNDSLEEALEDLGDAGVEGRRLYVSQGETVAERLLRAVGERVEPLFRALGQHIGDQDVVRQCSPLRLAELVLAQLGPATLSTLKATLQDEGLEPPGRWNTAAARAFVTSIGFPVEFASPAKDSRDAEELINGPIALLPLHDFQQEVFDGLKTLLESGTGRRRAVVSLPTGGGKTRVTVEAAVRLVLAPHGANRSVIWIAQADELCEQAVQAFLHVWVNLGAQHTDLRIVRLWGGRSNPASQELDKPVVVVASIQTFNSRFGSADLEWLRKPGLVVVDECHHAITPSYTSLLRWLDAATPRTGAPSGDEPPIIGLSATPFRTDDDESQRLARRFDNRWLPADQEQLYKRLLDQGVLANACYETVDSGATLTEVELERLAQVGPDLTGWDFDRLLDEINERLAGDLRRNDRIMECITKSKEQSILFFANSKLHAEEMAARLHLAGVAAAAVSGETLNTVRRWHLERFQRGELRVLCNHSVLSTGFDAPRTDMVFISRQVFSPVRYMQMVGRGLRGVQNGGTASCRIVTLMDNLGRFQERHPYHYCSQLYG